MKKIYCFVNACSPGHLSIAALGEDGEQLADHISSSVGWGKHDIGIESDWKHEQYNAHFGEGQWELEWLDEPLKHEGFQRALALYEGQGQQAAGGSQ